MTVRIIPTKKWKVLRRLLSRVACKPFTTVVVAKTANAIQRIVLPRWEGSSKTGTGFGIPIGGLCSPGGGWRGGNCECRCEITIWLDYGAPTAAYYNGQYNAISVIATLTEWLNIVLLIVWKQKSVGYLDCVTWPSTIKNLKCQMPSEISKYSWIDYVVRNAL